MTSVAYWCHFSPTSRSAAGQRMHAFIEHLKTDGRSVVMPGGGFQSDIPSWRRLLDEAWRTLTTRASLHIVSLPPYRSALVQAAMLFFLRGRRLIIDQRDVALDNAPKLERWVERWLLRRADALIVTTQAQRRAMMRRYGHLPRPFLIRNGASDDMAAIPASPRSRTLEQGRLRILYQGLVGGKKLAGIASHLACLDCDLDLAVFVDAWSSDEIDAIRRAWTGAGALTIHANLDAPALARLMDQTDVALNPVPDHMDYAFTVKTADYAVRGLPQLAIGSRRSVSRRAVERCRLGHAIDAIEALDAEALRLTIKKFRARTPTQLRLFQRATHAPRLIDLLREIES
jgi:hypothetical protein